MTKRVCVYLDGFNFYYQYAHSLKYDFKWVDPWTLTEERLREALDDFRLERLTIYTAWPVHRGSHQRQYDYLETLENAYKGRVQVVRGRHRGRPPREKQTDVNLAVDIVDDAHTKAYDVGVLVSGDTDFVGALKKAKLRGYRMILITPHARNMELSDEVAKADTLRGFPKEMFLRHSLTKKAGGPQKAPFVERLSLYWPRSARRRWRRPRRSGLGRRCGGAEPGRARG